MKHICACCGKEVDEENYPVDLMPFPHIECPICNYWIPCF